MSWTTTYKSAIHQLSTPSLYAEILKLENSIKHLQRSNEELVEHGKSEEDGSWIVPIIGENEEVIAKQTEQVKFVKDEIVERGMSNEHAEEDISLNTNGAETEHGNGTGLENGNVNGEEHGDEMDIDELDDGVHL